ncbi:MULTISPECIES: AAA family ATPase [unclassified Streptosporangium]|uniref:AAA family ATPase n=1 Tax=unclassified Streptosporangium TaxID=2632669 RepID=UPI003FA3DA83
MIRFPADGTFRRPGAYGRQATAERRLVVLDGQTKLVVIEEPETALHPAAAGALFDALTEASERAQVVITTQTGRRAPPP